MRRAIAAVFVLTAVYAASAAQTAKTLKVIQGTVRSFSGSLIVLEPQDPFVPFGRQVDISTATFEDATGKVIPRFAPAPHDSIIIVVDPNAPTVWRPTPRPGQPMPMIVRLLPIKALVIEKVDLAGKLWHAKS
jgi:hypothetical protein